MEFKFVSEKKNLRSAFTILIILESLRLGSGKGVNLGLCPETLFQCQCGSDPELTVAVPVEQCTFFYRWKPYCKPCGKLKVEDVCPKFGACKLCVSEGCSACPTNRFGQWCEKECKCQNGAECDIDGFCQCPKGYEGNNCENSSRCHPPIITAPVTETRVPLNQPLLMEYKCPHTHELIGASHISCLSTGEWDHPPPTCIRRCDVPKSIENGLVSTIRRPVLSGDSVEFSCNLGYTLFGTSHSKCEADGKMDRPLPICVNILECSEPTKVPKSVQEISFSVTQVTDRYFNGTVVKYQCDDNYLLFGKSEIVCLNSGLWNSPPPFCVRVPEVNINCSTTAAEILEENDVNVIVQCPPGCATTSYAVFGTVIYHYRSSVCRAAVHGGKISNNGGDVFLTNSGHYSDFLSSRMHGILSNEKLETGISFRFTRRPYINYRSKNSDNSDADKSGCPVGWIAFKNYCYIYVEKLKTFEMAKRTCKNLGSRLPDLKDVEFASSIRSILDKTKGNVNLTDGFVVWQGKYAMSKENHQLLTKFDHPLDEQDISTTNCTSIDLVENFLFAKIRKCDEPAPFLCVYKPKDNVEDSCEDPGPLLNGYAELKLENKGFEIGSIIKYRCAEFHYLSGEPRSVCSDNATWTNKKPRCIKISTCFDPPILAHGRMKVLSADENLRERQRGGLIRSKIGIPHFLRSSTVSNKIGLLTIKRPKRTTNRTNISVSSIAPTIYSSGDVLETPLTNKSINASNKNANETIDDVLLPKGHHRVGARVSYSCESRYYEIIGSKSRRCQSDGTWSGTEAVCLPICGRSDSPKTPFIYNSNATEKGQWPWQVGISMFYSDYDEWFLMCGGALVSESWVLTAAHCVTNGSRQSLPLESFKLQFGKYYRDDGLDDDMVQERRVKEIHVHHDYDHVRFDSDIALVLLEGPVTLTPRVQPVCLPTDLSTRKNIDGQKRGVVTGWGLNEIKINSETLRQAVIPVVGQEKCEEGYRIAGYPQTISENMFCAGYEQGRTDTCSGDSGGPLVFAEDSSDGRRWTIEGIVSWGGPVECGEPNQYGVYTFVHKFLPWIQQIV